MRIPRLSGGRRGPGGPRPGSRPGPPIERVSLADLMLLDCDVGPAPMQAGAVLLLDAGPRFDVGAATAVIGERVTKVPRLRQVLVRTPPGCGRPVWLDDPGFDIGAHVRSVRCDPPGDDVALRLAWTAIATQRLPWSRPLWSATFVTGLADGQTGLVLMFHHVMADGIGGLAVLGSLVDGAGRPAPVWSAQAGPAQHGFPRPLPSRGRLAAEAAGSAASGAGRALRRTVGLREALTELDPAAAARPAGRPASWSLNGRTGPRRSFDVARAGLAPIHAYARAHGATVNDVMLLAVTRALASLVTARGEVPGDLVASVIVAARPAADPSALGNLVGIMPVRLPAAGTRADQLGLIAASTRAHKTRRRGASGELLAPAFRVLAATGALAWFINHQPFVNVFVTNLRGPQDRQRFAGAEITDLLPVTMVVGNVALSFAVLSYAGVISVVVTADPERIGDHGALAALLQRELDELCGGAALDRALRRPGS